MERETESTNCFVSETFIYLNILTHKPNYIYQKLLYIYFKQK